MSDQDDSVAQDQSAEQYNGFVIVRLSRAVSSTAFLDIRDLRVLARAGGYRSLSEVLDRFPECTASRLITALRPQESQELERKAARNGYSPSHSITAYWHIDARQVADPNRLVQLLNGLPEVDLAYRQQSGSDPNVVVDDPHAVHQEHLLDAPVGVSAKWAWTQPHGSGSTVAFVDLEMGWLFSHEDLPTVVPLAGVSRDVRPLSVNHGTAVLGIAVGVDNTKGILGVAPTPAWVSVTSHYDLATNSYGHVVPAIENVLPHLNAGDVLLIEWQTNGLLPAETDFLVWEKICQATSLGIVVIEAAGNGFKDLDTVPMFSDSGAILVGACVSALDATGQAHDRLPLSNFGARVDCHAFGQNIVTTGPGNPPLGVLDPGTGPNNEYRKDFGATSGAAAVVAGAAVVLQGMHKGVKGGPLTSIQLRNVFRTTGTNQGTGVAGNIGRMPDLKAAAASLGLIPSVPAAPNNLRIVS